MKEKIILNKMGRLKTAALASLCLLIIGLFIGTAVLLIILKRRECKEGYHNHMLR